MTQFALLEIQQVIYDVLSGDATLGAMVTGVYDYVPQDTAYPYVVIGDMDGRDWSASGLDGLESRASIEAYSRYGGRKEALQIMESIHSLLHDGSLTMSGHALVSMRFESGQVIPLGDGHTYRGQIRFRLLSQAVV